MAGTVLPAPAGTDLGWGVEGAQWHHSRDWPLTSSGSTVHEPLPPGAERPPREELIQRLATTTGLCHDVKTHGGVLGQPGYLLPAPLWRVHCNKDLRDKLQLHAWRVPADPGGAAERDRHRFCGWPNLPPEPAHHAGPQPFGLAAHHSDGASKSMVGSTENKPLAGSVFYVRDGAVLSRLEPYVSVTSQDIRAFTPQELQGYARKDALTYWQFEGYPKAWGHGLRDPSLGKDAVPPLRLPGPPTRPQPLPESHPPSPPAHAGPCCPAPGGAEPWRRSPTGPPAAPPAPGGPQPGPPPSAPPQPGPRSWQCP
ncbi:stabilizer of axonemal microtubules 3-like [Chrysemys picta bellii]|uniref:stabilizer of axonemal microtubules 3-like n=1 Tax=Chrysemys picta bellii TaxID=8478 RepID=UPI0032B304EA